MSTKFVTVLTASALLALAASAAQATTLGTAEIRIDATLDLGVDEDGVDATIGFAGDYDVSLPLGPANYFVTLSAGYEITVLEGPTDVLFEDDDEILGFTAELGTFAISDLIALPEFSDAIDFLLSLPPTATDMLGTVGIGYLFELDPGSTLDVLADSVVGAGGFDLTIGLTDEEDGDLDSFLSSFGAIESVTATGYLDAVIVATSPVPGPASLALLPAGLGALVLARRRRRKAA